MATQAVFNVPKLQLPALPTAPTAPAGAGPNPANVGQYGWLGTQASMLPGKYNPQLSLARTNLEGALKGIGGFTFGQDDPNTPENEALNVSYNPEHAPGEAERAAAYQARSSVGNKIYSSFADKNIGAALGRLSREAINAVNQYAGQINQIAGAWSSDYAQIGSQLSQLVGSDMQYYTDPSQPWNAPNPGQYLGGGQGIVWQGPNAPTQGQLDELASIYPGMSITPKKSSTGDWYVDVYPGISGQDAFYESHLGNPAPDPSRPYVAPPSIPALVGGRIK